MPDQEPQVEVNAAGCVVMAFAIALSICIVSAAIAFAIWII